MKNFSKTFEKVEEQVKELFKIDSSHDFYHLEKTMKLAIKIQKIEGGDKIVIVLASFLHDIHRIINVQTGKYCSPEASLPKVREILDKAGFDDKNRIDKILNCIKVHEEYNFSDGGKTAKDIESLIVQDADNLECMGAIGIARTFAYGGVHNIPIFVPEVPLPKGNWNDHSPQSASQIHHFYEKLLRLKDNMNTKTAKKLALKRHKFVVNFLKQFFAEWKGEI